jgi:polyhydroxyalkanoate synthesis regulator phasin
MSRVSEGVTASDQVDALKERIEQLDKQINELQS